MKASEASAWLLLERLLQLALRLRRCIQMVTLLREPCVHLLTLLLAGLFVLYGLLFERAGGVLVDRLNLPFGVRDG